MAKIIAIANQKGGVGKTTTAVNLGTALQLMGNKVMLIDLDAQASLSAYLDFADENSFTIGDLFLIAAKTEKNTEIPAISECVKYNKTNNLSFIPADSGLAGVENKLLNVNHKELILKKILSDKLFNEFDYVIIDCQPSLGILVINALTAADGVLIPVQPQKFALDGLTKFINLFGKVKSKINPRLEIIGILPTWIENTTLCRDNTQMLMESYGEKLFNTSIRRSVEAQRSAEKMKSLCLNKTRLGEEYKSLAAEVATRCELI